MARVILGHEGRKQKGEKLFAEYTGEGHIYRMPYEDWVDHGRPTIVTVTVQEGVTTAGVAPDEPTAPAPKAGGGGG